MQHRQAEQGGTRLIEGDFRQAGVGAVEIIRADPRKHRQQRIVSAPAVTTMVSATTNLRCGPQAGEAGGFAATTLLFSFVSTLPATM